MGIAALFSSFESLDRRLSNGLLSLLVLLLPWNPVTRSKGRSGFARWLGSLRNAWVTLHLALC